jgi:PsbP-like protein
MRTTRSLAVTTLLLVAVAAAVGLTACGSSSSSTKPSSSPVTRTYTNTDYGFSLSYPGSLVESPDSTPSVEAGSRAKLTVGFVDPGGTYIGDTFVNGVAVSVYELTKEITADLMPQFKSELEGAVAQMQQQVPSAQMTQLETAAINGVPGYKLGTACDSQGTSMKVVRYFLVKGRIGFAVTEQAAEQDWTKYATGFDAAVNSFTVK